MSNDAHPVLSITVRRFGYEVKDDIVQSLGQLQDAAADHPGYLVVHNSLSQKQDECELVNVFAFDSRENLERWESSDVRRTRLAELDRHPQEATKHTRFDELAQLLQPRSPVAKIEIVAILIFWILLLGSIGDFVATRLLPAAFPPFWQSVLLVSINVLLISYVFLPWSSRMVARLKMRFRRRRRKT